MVNSRVPKFIDADQAVQLISSGDVVSICGAGGGMTEPTSIIDALARRYRELAEPNDLTLMHTSGLGDRGDRGMSPLALPGLSKRIIGGHWGQSPRLAEMAQSNEIEAYNFPQGIMSQLFRCAAAGQPGILTKVGLGTFMDPRNQGGKLNDATTEELIQIVRLANEEWMFYPAIAPDVAIIRGTTSDLDGYISMEDEISYLDTLAMAQAAHNNGGTVIAQVKRVVKAGSLHPKSVRIPGFIVDAVVEVPEQKQLYVSEVDRFISGDFQAVIEKGNFLKLSERKVIARRALMEVSPGDVGNVGVGIPDGVGPVAREEGIADSFTLTVEHGTCGGESLQGIFFGASINMRAMLDMPSQFDFYHGGGLDIALLSFAEVDRMGNVNIHKFNGKIMGTGGFIDICQTSKKVVFCGTLTAGSLKVTAGDFGLQIDQEGNFRKFIADCQEVTFSALDALARGQQVVYVTERAVFRLDRQGLVLCELAPGVDIEHDILAQMEFRPQIAENLTMMDPRLFREAQMGLANEWL